MAYRKWLPNAHAKYNTTAKRGRWIQKDQFNLLVFTVIQQKWNAFKKATIVPVHMWNWLFKKNHFTWHPKVHFYQAVFFALSGTNLQRLVTDIKLTPILGWMNKFKWPNLNRPLWKDPPKNLLGSYGDSIQMLCRNIISVQPLIALITLYVLAL